MTTQTRRAHARLAVAIDVTLHHGGREIQARCLNISQGGMFLETEFLPIGDTVTIEFELPGLHKTVSTEARVAWSERDPWRGIGVQFIGLRAIEVWAINQLFRKQSRSV